MRIDRLAPSINRASNNAIIAFSLHYLVAGYTCWTSALSCLCGIVTDSEFRIPIRLLRQSIEKTCAYDEHSPTGADDIADMRISIPVGEL
ncbi:hypothetical protein KIN20_013435 [Parelaphostrongylus tenuis]|uniref:Uncharacterized protein n=1 Tax=Parelaphostrongylus tenuis TaxID=148309 RepID=A0AAD5QMK9_PARTN|nr:hypothetical protein KIN20_013435 [Parelaphostrongylus tenuis]